MSELKECSICGIPESMYYNKLVKEDNKILCKVCAYNELKKEIKIKEAIAQFIGFNHCREGFDLLGLVSSMGLTKQEWKIIKKDYEILNDNQIKEIDGKCLD